jgi:hypothetical protein
MLVDMTDEARRQAAEILSAAADQYRINQAHAEALIANADERCDCPAEECDCPTPDEMRADASTRATLANAAATMALAMVTFLTPKE